ncbi:MAG: radical SAM protein [Nitrospiraceae bacterium]|nr:radical SAM protein [Nitrospiraceae bacterium]
MAVDATMSVSSAAAKPLVFRVCGSGDPISVILKLVGEVCNLDCSYCYEKRKPYRGSRILKAEAVGRLLAQLHGKMVALEFHGGEPLLYPESEFLELSRTLAAHSSQIARLSMQTNGALLTPAKLKWLMQLFPALELGLSIDGPDELNGLRVDLKGRPSINHSLAALSACEKASIDVGVICVVTKSSLNRATEIMNFFARQSAIKVVKLNPCFDANVQQGAGPRRRPQIRSTVERAGLQPLPWAISPAEYSSFLEEAQSIWSNEIGPSRFILEPLLTTIRSLRGVPVSSCHFSARKCSHVFTLYPDGELGSCDELDRAPAHYGDLGACDPMVSAKETWGPARPSNIQELLDACIACDVASICGGGCLATRQRFQAAGRSEEYCDHRRLLLRLGGAFITDAQAQ